MQTHHTSAHSRRRNSSSGSPHPRAAQANRRRRERATPVEVLLVALFAVAIIVVTAFCMRPAEFTAESTCAISVGPQQTLWDVAQEHPIDGLSTAQTVDAIRSLNKMSDSSLAVGQILLVPSSSPRIEAAVASR